MYHCQPFTSRIARRVLTHGNHISLQLDSQNLKLYLSIPFCRLLERCILTKNRDSRSRYPPPSLHRLSITR